MAEDVFYTDEDFNADEKTLWKGYRRILGIKYFFTKYTITNKRIIVESGVLRYTSEEVMLFRVNDLSLRKGILERAVSCGTVVVRSSDKNSPILNIGSIRDSEKVRNLLSHQVEIARKEARVRNTEYSM